LAPSTNTVITPGPTVHQALRKLMDNSNYLVQYVPAVPEKKKSSSTRVTEKEEAERERKEREEKRSGKRLRWH